MASLNKAFNKDFFESILPTFGNPRSALPTWDEGQKMFICNQYESLSGNRYYKGVRFCNNIVVVEKVGLFNSWTYIDGIEIYAFNERHLELVQKRDYEKTFRNEEFVRKETESMLSCYLKGMAKMNKCRISEEQIDDQVKTIVDGCYKSFLDADYNTRLMQILPQIEK